MRSFVFSADNSSGLPGYISSFGVCGFSHGYSILKPESGSSRLLDLTVICFTISAGCCGESNSHYCWGMFMARVLFLLTGISRRRCTFVAMFRLFLIF